MPVSAFTREFLTYYKAIFKVEDDFLVPVHVGYVFEENATYIIVAKDDKIVVRGYRDNMFFFCPTTVEIITPYIIYQLEFLHGIPFRH